MERVNRILHHPLYREAYEKLQDDERDRIFCSHTMEHFLDVARLMWISLLEDHLQQQGDMQLHKELVYAAALLHDIGRAQQYSLGTPHEEAGASLAGQIMVECGFEGTEIRQVQEAILCHRGRGASGKHTVTTSRNNGCTDGNVSDDPGQFPDLGAYLYRADKQSRCCFLCPAERECNWSDDRKNMGITQ